ncbi:MAG: hypothetical protein ACRC6X_01510 [Culicoidibacterales bacterium]
MMEKLSHFGINKEKNRVKDKLDKIKDMDFPEQDDLCLDRIFSELILIDGHIVGRTVSYLNNRVSELEIIEDSNWVNVYNDKILRFPQKKVQMAFNKIEYEELLKYWLELYKLYVMLKELCLAVLGNDNNGRESIDFYIIQKDVHFYSDEKPIFLSISEKKETKKDFECVFEGKYKERHGQKIEDLIANDAGLLIVSTKLLQLMMENISAKVLPIGIIEESSGQEIVGYHIVFPENVTNCLYLTKTIYHLDKEHRIMEINAPFLDGNVVRNKEIFQHREILIDECVYEITPSFFYVSCKLKNKIEKSNCTGIIFLAIDKYMMD